MTRNRIEFRRTATLAKYLVLMATHGWTEKTGRTVGDLVRRGQQDGAIAGGLDPLLTARVFIALQNGLVQLWLASPKAFSLKRAAPDLVDVLMRGVQASD